MSDSLTARAAGRGSITYTAVFTPGEDGWICAQVAEVPEAISQGRTLEQAKANVIEALEGALAWRVAEGELIPRSGQVTVGPVSVAQRHGETGAKSFVPRHREIGVGVARTICRQLGIPPIPKR